MLTSFSEFKFYQSFRIPVEKADDLRFLIAIENEDGSKRYIEDALLMDISLTGLGFMTQERIKVETEFDISLQFRKNHLDLSGRVVRAFTNTVEDTKIIYGVEVDDEKRIRKFLEQYVQSFNSERLKDCLIEAALKERYTKASDGFEMFSLLLSLFKDITNFGDKDGFIENMLEEVVRILNAQRSSIFLINAETNELEAFAALGANKEGLKFDYRLGIAGSVFTTGIAQNIDTVSDPSKFNDAFDQKTGFKTTSIICYPIYNREDKIIGVIEVLNKRNQDRFTVEDEKTMKVLSLVFSSVFHNYSPISEMSQIRRFSTPFDREHVLIGKDRHISDLRSSILKVKDLDSPLLIEGEPGVGKTLYASILHFEGKRGLSSFELIECSGDQSLLEQELFGEHSKLILCKGGTVVLKEVEFLSKAVQQKLLHIMQDRRLPNSKISIDLRIIATSRTDLQEKVLAGDFSSELYHYFSQTQIYINPLRNRMEDLELLINYFLRVECRKHGFLLKNFSKKAIKQMRNYEWPDNVAELQKCVQRAVAYNPRAHLIHEMLLDQAALPLVNMHHQRKKFGDITHVTNNQIPLKERLALVERQMIVDEIKRQAGNKSRAAKAMNISREALRKKMLISDEIIKTLDNQGKINLQDFSPEFLQGDAGDLGPHSEDTEKKAA